MIRVRSAIRQNARQVEVDPAESTKTTRNPSIRGLMDFARARPDNQRVLDSESKGHRGG